MLAGPALLRPDVAAGHDIGPSTTVDPYLVPSLPGVRTVAILTVGDMVQGYRMVGIPDGLGAFVSRHNQFTLMMNHELTATAGIARAHGSKGAFVSRWVIDRRTLEVMQGRGLHALAAEGLPVGPDDEPLRAGHHGVGAPLLGRPAAGERLLSSGQGHARAAST